MSAPAAPGEGTLNRQRPGVELLLVLSLSLGQSAVYSVLSIINKLSQATPLNQQTTTINHSITPDRPWLDLAYQIAGIVFPLIPAALALYLLRLSGDRPKLGLDLQRKGFDLGAGTILAAAIGIPGLAFYVFARQWGFNTNVSVTNLTQTWWTVPVLIGLAAMNAVLEEVIVVGFWFVRTANLGWSTAVIVISSALLRGSYHLYQGFGGFVGNIVMGVVFGLVFVKVTRVGPLIVAHFLLDVVAFVGYAALVGVVDWL